MIYYKQYKKDRSVNMQKVIKDIYYKGIMKEDIIKKLKKSEEEIDNGEGIEANVAFKELKKKYGY